MGRDRKDSAVYTAFDDAETINQTTPEKNLLRAVLLNAVADMQRHGEFEKKATEFFLNQDDDYIFSFKSICEYLHLDPKQVLMLVGLCASPFKRQITPESSDS